VRDELGQVVGLLSSGEDITERRRAEQALTRSEGLLRAAQAIARLGNYEIHLPAGSTFWSEQMYSILGRDPAEGPVALGDFPATCVHPDDRERCMREWRRALNDSGRCDLEFRVVRPDSTTREVHTLAQIQPSADGESLVITGTLHDITERKLAEDELRQGQERLTHVGRLSTMGEMATGLAHEINQPLTAIATYAQAAVRMVDAPGGADPADLREALVQITNQALRAGEVIRRLRGFVKNRATRAETIDLNRLIEDLRVLAEPDARVNDVRLTMALAEQVPPVAADPVQIQQVLLNLVRNAIEASPAGGTVTLTTRMETSYYLAGAHGREQFLSLDVSDQGPGIPAENLARIFSPFFTTKADGTGLGLAISQRIVSEHGGVLRVKSEPTVGTIFTVTLPVERGLSHV